MEEKLQHHRNDGRSSRKTSSRLTKIEALLFKMTPSGLFIHDLFITKRFMIFHCHWYNCTLDTVDTRRKKEKITISRQNKNCGVQSTKYRVHT